MWTNLEGFTHLQAFELDILLEAPVLITILVGAADNELDREERVWSERLMKVRTYSKPGIVADFYRVAAADFQEKVDDTLEKLPEDLNLRSDYLQHRLASVDHILNKLDPALAADLYKSFRGLAHETAQASGGFLRIGATSAAEAKWVNLPMLQPRFQEGETEKEWEDWTADN
jgi:hypothetical protein